MISFGIPFITILLAELLDKSQVTLLLLATKSKQHFPLLLGSILAFAIVDGIAMVLGATIITVIPLTIVRYISAALFLVFGVLTYIRSANDAVAKLPSNTSFGSAFLLVFLSEWGDKTQLASAIFATQYNPFIAFLGVMLALSLLSAAAVYLGKYLTHYVKREQIEKISGGIFILLGLLFLLN